MWLFVQTEKEEVMQLDENDVQFYKHLIDLIMSVIEEDINIYAPVLSQ